MSVARNSSGEYIGLQCDTCAAPSPPAAEILAAHGLARLGWWCSGGTHICPSCPQPIATTGSLAGVK